jgi:hypothetical protein
MSDTIPEACDHEKSDWNFPYLFAVLFAALILQLIFLPCMCSASKAKLALAGALDVLVLVRALTAYVSKERNEGWKVYCVLALSSFIWIEWLAEIVL